MHILNYITNNNHEVSLSSYGSDDTAKYMYYTVQLIQIYADGWNKRERITSFLIKIQPFSFLILRYIFSSVIAIHFG